MNRLLTVPLTLVILSMLVGSAFGEIHPNSPCNGCGMEGNNPESKIFASGHVDPINGLNTINTIWKSPSGITIYQADLTLNSNGYFNNEFENPMLVKNMAESGVYTTEYRYGESIVSYSWNYKSFIIQVPETQNTEQTSNSTVVETPIEIPVETPINQIDEPQITEYVTNILVGNHSLGISTSDYQGTKKLVTFTGDEFRTSEILDIEVYSQNNTMIANAQTTVFGNGEFSVPSMVETNELVNQNYRMVLSGEDTNIEITISWDGIQFSFVKIQSAIIEPSITSGNWTAFLYGLDQNDRVGLIRAVLQYLLS